MNVKRFPFNVLAGLAIAASLISLAGCVKLRHVDQLLTLKSVSESSDQMDKYVAQQNKKFEFLLQTIKAGTLGQYSDQQSAAAAFGDPVYVEASHRDGRDLEKWLYRYATKYFNSEKVYLYFDASRKLVDWEHVPPPQISSQTENQNVAAP